MRHLSEQIEIAAPAERVWAVLADFGGVADWAPYMRRSELIGKQRSGVGTSRSMRHAWGFRFQESVTEWITGKGYSFDVHHAPFPMKDVFETWELRERDGRTTVSTCVRYRMGLGLPGTWLDAALLRFVVRREMRAGLRGLKTYVENVAARTAAVPATD